MQKSSQDRSLQDSDYNRLLMFRTGIRRFLQWSESQARQVGLSPEQHQLLLAVRGHLDPRGPTIGEIADYLLLRHHSAVARVDAAEADGLVSREADPYDRRVARVALTPKGSAALEHLSTLHLAELERMSGEMDGLWEGLGPFKSTHGGSRGSGG